ncbi:MAG: SpoIID/LytB domain-containing protein [Candidatus Gastranaerophilales bacterium]|nr:SpoIID/LytB domain-containing protein [Candidatus Gastranaerophilales bacterium]
MGDKIDCDAVGRAFQPDKEKYLWSSGRKARPTLLLFVLAMLFFTGLKTFAQSSEPIRQTVRVAISDTGFKTRLYNQISIIATSDYGVYDKQTATPVLKLSQNDVLKIKFSSGKFDLNVNNKSVAKNLNTILVLDCPKGLLGIENLKRNGKQALYHGVLELTPKNDNQFYLINVLDLQDYLKGVVPNEMPVRFGLEALKAQAIAARNYVLLPRAKEDKSFDVDDSVASQVYFGAGTESELSNKAVNETEGLVLLHGWDLILAQYCSTAGGYTENYENTFSELKTKEFPSKAKPYLQGRPDIYNVAPLNREEEARLFYMSYPDSYDIKSPYYRWQREFSREELEKTLTKTLAAQSKTGFVKPEFKENDVLGELKELKVNKRGVSGKIIELEIVTDKQNYHISKELVIRRVLQKNGVSLPSANVVFENLYDTNKKLNKIVAYGGGYGHGVGMSQYGAGFMAISLHKSFDKILKRYYTGISIGTVPVILSAGEGQKIAAMQFFAPEKKAFLVIDNKYQIKEFNANINGVPVAFELSNNILPFNRISRIDISSYIRQGKNNITFYFPEGEKNKAIRLYVELVEKDECEYNF